MARPPDLATACPRISLYVDRGKIIGSRSNVFGEDERGEVIGHARFRVFRHGAFKKEGIILSSLVPSPDIADVIASLIFGDFKVFQRIYWRTGVGAIDVIDVTAMILNLGRATDIAIAIGERVFIAHGAFALVHAAIFCGVANLTVAADICAAIEINDGLAMVHHRNRAAFVRAFGGLFLVRELAGRLGVRNAHIGLAGGAICARAAADGLHLAIRPKPSARRQTERTVSCC